MSERVGRGEEAGAGFLGLVVGAGGAGGPDGFHVSDGLAEFGVECFEVWCEVVPGVVGDLG